MSLLLDALKKAAEKKAKKAADSSESIDETEVESTELGADATEQLKTQAEDTEFEQTQQQTEIDSTEFDHTEQQTELDVAQYDEVTEQRTVVETSADDDTELQSYDEVLDVESTESRTELDETAFDSTEQQTQLDSIEGDTAEIPSLAGEDNTLFIPDDLDEDDLVLAAGRAGEEVTSTEVTDTYSMTNEIGEEVELTDDDVTEFMGDGVRDDTDISPLKEQPVAQNEDTTVTNPDSLSLTDMAYDEDLSLNAYEDSGYSISQDKSQPDNANVQDDTASIRDNDDTAGLQLEDIPAPERTTEMVDQTSNSSVDIDQLTNDQTLTVKSTTATRTLAPDNYDRTLLKFSDGDVSNIFPGMKTESDTVMTPDYAKKVFVRKSQGIKTSNLKIFTGLGLLILVLVSVWGLFQLQEESDLIDNSLVRLKRDPMPGIIKPKVDKESQSLFTDDAKQIDGKVIEMIATADQDSPPYQESVVETESAAANQMEQSIAEDTGSRRGRGNVDDSTADNVSENARSLTSKSAIDSDNEQVATSVQASAPATTTGTQSDAGKTTNDFQITTSSRISEKDQLLSAAYSSYESGDTQAAARQYEKVISLDHENRDALLGRAAIYVHDNELESAIELYQRVLLSNPKDSLAMTSLISVANIDPKAGESQLKGLLREQPESPYLYFALGNMYGSQQRWAEAQTAYFEALQFKPEDPNYAYNLAVSLEHINKPDAAIAFYQRALENQQNALASFDSELVSQRVEVLSQ